MWWAWVLVVASCVPLVGVLVLLCCPGWADRALDQADAERRADR